jgi:hypothetical protein
VRRPPHDTISEIARASPRRPWAVLGSRGSAIDAAHPGCMYGIKSSRVGEARADVPLNPTGRVETVSC